MGHETLAERVRAIRAIRQMTQAQLAEKAGMARTDINKLERGNLRLGRDRLARVAAALDVSVLELRPEAEADPLGLTMLDRLEALEAQAEKDRRAAVRAQRATAARLADLEARLELLEQRSAPPSTGAAAS